MSLFSAAVMSKEGAMLSAKDGGTKTFSEATEQKKIAIPELTGTTDGLRGVQTQPWEVPLGV